MKSISIESWCDRFELGGIVRSAQTPNQSFLQCGSWLARAVFPLGERRRVDPEDRRQLLLAQPVHEPICLDRFNNRGILGDGERTVSKELDNARHGLERWPASTSFPVVHGHGIDTKHGRYVLLKQIQVKPPFSQVISQRD